MGAQGFFSSKVPLVPGCALDQWSNFILEDCHRKEGVAWNSFSREEDIMRESMLYPKSSDAFSSESLPGANHYIRQLIRAHCCQSRASVIGILTGSQERKGRFIEYRPFSAQHALGSILLPKHISKLYPAGEQCSSHAKNRATSAENLQMKIQLFQPTRLSQEEKLGHVVVQCARSSDRSALYLVLELIGNRTT